MEIILLPIAVTIAVYLSGGFDDLIRRRRGIHIFKEKTIKEDQERGDF